MTKLEGYELFGNECIIFTMTMIIFLYHVTMGNSGVTKLTVHQNSTI